MNGSEPVTLQDAGSAYMAVQQNKAVGLVGNTMTMIKLINQSKTGGGVELRMMPDPMLLEPVGIDMDKAGEIHQI